MTDLDLNNLFPSTGSSVRVAFDLTAVGKPPIQHTLTIALEPESYNMLVVLEQTMKTLLSLYETIERELRTGDHKTYRMPTRANTQRKLRLSGIPGTKEDMMQFLKAIDDHADD